MSFARSLLFLTIALQAINAYANDNLLAHRLLAQGEYAQAAEIFTDPAWKGIALYRSAQWWRAAEAFVRANDPVSAFNLGNCYVKLGYYALALDAYQRALSLDQTLDDARHNARIMRELLALEDSENQSGASQPSGEEIDRIDSDNESGDKGKSDGGDEDAEINDSASGSQSQPGEQSMTPSNNAQAGPGGQSSDDEQQSAAKREISGSANGQPAAEQASSQPSGGSESDIASDASQAAATRTALETEQATAQWLNRIQHDSQLFLSRRIKLEDKRRRAAGQSAPAGGSSW